MNGKLCIFSIHDNKAEAFMRPFAAPTPAFAMRSFADMVNDPEQPIAQHPADYTLFKVGVMSEETGEIIPDKISLGSAVEFIENNAPALPPEADRTLQNMRGQFVNETA